MKKFVFILLLVSIVVTVAETAFAAEKSCIAEYQMCVSSGGYDCEGRLGDCIANQI